MRVGTLAIGPVRYRYADDDIDHITNLNICCQ